MSTFTGLTTLSGTSINNSGEIRLGNDLNPGAIGQVIISQGQAESVIWGTSSGTIANPLTMGTNLSLASGNASFNGAVADTINATSTDTQLNLTGVLPIVVNDLGGLNREVDIDIDSNTMGVSGGELEVLKVPNALTKGTNITFSSGTTYDGSAAITINAIDNNTEYTAGTNLNLSGTTFNLDTSISGMINISFLNDGTTTSITGSNYPNKPTTGTNLKLTDTSNIISPYFFHNVYGTASTDFDSLTTSYAAGSILGALGASIVAKQTALCVELIVYNYAISSNRDTDMRLVDKGGTEWSIGSSEGGSGTGTIQTEREVHRADETDRQIVHQTWSITGLTVGSTYTFNPQARTSATSNFLAAGGSYPSAFFRGYYLPEAGI